MYKLPENENCNGVCDKKQRLENMSILDYIKKVHDECILRVNLRGVMVRPCHKLFVLSRELGQKNYYENKYFQFRS